MAWGFAGALNPIGIAQVPDATRRLLVEAGDAVGKGDKALPCCRVEVAAHLVLGGVLVEGSIGEA